MERVGSHIYRLVTAPLIRLSRGHCTYLNINHCTADLTRLQMYINLFVCVWILCVVSAVFGILEDFAYSGYLNNLWLLAALIIRLPNSKEK